MDSVHLSLVREMEQIMVHRDFAIKSFQVLKKSSYVNEQKIFGFWVVSGIFTQFLLGT